MSEIATIVDTFSTRLDTLDQLLETGLDHFGGSDAFLAERIIDDMHPLGTQVAFTCDQPTNFCRWMRGLDAENLEATVDDMETARGLVRETRQLLGGVAHDDGRLDAEKRIHLGTTSYIDLPGRRYVRDFLIPNFYFHLVTAYDILRKSGVPIGKRDYMLHLLPYVRNA